MPGHFTVDLDVESLRAAQRWLGTMADEAPREAQGITGMPDQIGDDWTGPASEKIKEEMRDLARNLRDFGPSFGEARDAVKTFADAADTFETTTVPDFNRRWDELNEDAEADIEAADRRAEEAEDGEQPTGPTRGDIAGGLRYALQGLTHEFGEAKSELRRKATALGTALSGTSPVAVPEAAVTSFTGSGGTASSLSHWPEVSPEASNSLRVDVTPDSIDAFDFSNMTEEERREFNERNPGVLDTLMAEENPSGHLMNQVHALGAPQVDGEDADSDYGDLESAMEDNAGQERFLDGFATSEELNRYAEWAQRHGGPAFSSDQIEYLSRWTGHTWEKREDITRYIDEAHLVERGYTGADGYQSNLVEQEFDDATRDRLHASMADSYLALSDHRLGGGYERLPEDMRHAIEEAPSYDVATDVTGMEENENFLEAARILTRGGLMAGDGLSKELATNASNSLDWADGSLHFPRGMPDYPQDLMADVLGLVSRNEHATADLMTGEDMGENYDPGAFLKNIYAFEWDDDGAGAAAMTDWIHEALDAGEGSPSHAEAMRAFDGLTRTLTSTGDDGIFADLMDAQGDDSVGQVNPALVRSLMGSVGNEQVFDSLSRDPEGGDPLTSPLDEGERVRLFMLLAGDEETAARLSATAQAKNADLLAAYHDLGEGSPEQGQALEDYADRMSRITGLTDAGIFNAAYEETNDITAATEAQIEAVKAGAGLLTQFDPSGLSGTLVGFLSAENPEPADPDVVEDWDQSGRHLTAANNLHLAQLLTREGPPDGLPPGELDDILNSDMNDSQKAGAIRELIGSAGATQLNDELQDLYPDLLNTWVAGPGEEIDDLVDHGSQPSPG